MQLGINDEIAALDISVGFTPHSQVTWRSGVFSDWDIVVGNRRFHVHRFIMGVGPRSSPFLYRLFFNQSFLDHTDRTTHIAIHKQSDESSHSGRFADAFDEILSFIYEGQCSIDLNTCMPFWCLADYLCMHQLVDMARAFIYDAVNLENLSAVLQEAAVFSLPEIQDICARRIARRFAFLKVSTWENLPPTFLGKVLRSPRLTGSSNLASERLALYMKRNDFARVAGNVRLLVRALLENPKHHIAPKDSVYFLSLISANDVDQAAVNMVSTLLSQIIARHFRYFPRSSLLKLSVVSFRAVMTSQHLEADHEMIDATIIKFIRHHFNQLSIDDLRTLIEICRHQRKIVHSLLTKIRLIHDSRPIVQLCIDILLNEPELPDVVIATPVDSSPETWHSRGEAMWISFVNRKDRSNCRVALQIPSVDQNDVQVCVALVNPDGAISNEIMHLVLKDHD